MTVPLLELPGAPAAPGQPRRRWFSSPQMDLIAWESATGAITAFQLCYDKPLAERSLTWRQDSGFSHQAVDAGNPEGPGHKATPLLTTTEALDPARLQHALARAGGHLPPALLDFVQQRLQQYPDPT